MLNPKERIMEYRIDLVTCNFQATGDDSPDQVLEKVLNKRAKKGFNLVKLYSISGSWTLIVITGKTDSTATIELAIEKMSEAKGGVENLFNQYRDRAKQFVADVQEQLNKKSNGSDEDATV